MIPEQLDLFGGPPKPPKKIKVDDGPAIIYPEPAKPVIPEPEPATEETVAEVPLMQEETPVEDSGQEATPSIEAAIENTTPDSAYGIQEEVVEEPQAEQFASLEEEMAVAGEEQEFAAYEEEMPLPQEEEDLPVEQEPAEGPSIVSAPVEFEREPVQQADAQPAETVKADKVPFNPELGNIPPDEILFKRQYYSMRETATMFNITHSMLRYWENEFDILQPRKNRKGDRYFRPVDIKNLQLIMHLLKVRKYTIEGAREYLRNHNKALDTFELVQRLEKLKTFLHELKAHL